MLGIQLFQHVVEARSDVVPSTLILGLFLDPHYLRIRVLLKVSLQLLEREGAELLKPQYSNIVLPILCSFFF